MRIAVFLVAACCVLSAACQSESPAPVTSPTPTPTVSVMPPSPSPSPSPTPLPFPPLSPSPSVAAQSYSKAVSSVQEIDRYLAWFLEFVQRRADANTAANKRTQQIAAQAPAPSGALQESLQATIVQNQALASDFVKKTPPSACAELSRLYGVVLVKSIAVLEAKRQAFAMGGEDDEARSNLGTADVVKNELAQVNAEIERLYQEYPSIKTPKLILTP